MTISEIRSVSIRQYLDVTGTPVAFKRRGKYYYLSPYRTENTPSFAVNPDENLWYDYATREGGNIINLHQKIKPHLDNLSADSNLLIDNFRICCPQGAASPHATFVL